MNLLTPETSFFTNEFTYQTPLSFQEETSDQIPALSDIADLSLAIQNQSDTDSEKEEVLTPLRSNFNDSFSSRKEFSSSPRDSNFDKGLASVVNYILPYTFRSFEHSRSLLIKKCYLCFF